MNAVLIAEAIRAAQQLTGKKQVTGEDVRRGLETLNITEARWKELGLEGLCRADPFELRRPQRPQRHLLVEWDGTKWVKQAGLIEPIKDKVLPLIDSGGRGLCEGQCRLAEAHRGLRQVVVRRT